MNPFGKPQKEKGEIHKKIEQLYQNYGIDTSSMTEEEFQRLVETYSKSKEKLDLDLEKSEKHRDKFLEDII